MGTDFSPEYASMSVSFATLVEGYKRLQADLVNEIRQLGSGSSSTNPGQFILLQFRMAQVTQIGESISNMVAQVNSVISGAIRNQKTQ